MRSINGIALGDKCRDEITGFTGICNGIAEFLIGPVEVLLVPQVDPATGDVRNSQWCIAGRVTVVQKAAVKIAAKGDVT